MPPHAFPGAGRAQVSGQQKSQMLLDNPRRRDHLPMRERWTMNLLHLSPLHNTHQSLFTLLTIALGYF